MWNFLKSGKCVQQKPLQDIPTITVTNYGSSDSSSSEPEDEIRGTGDGDEIPTPRKASFLNNRGSNYLKTRKDCKQSPKKETKLSDSSEWETEGEQEAANPLEKPKSKCRTSAIPPSQLRQGQGDRNFADKFNPHKFGYVSLNDKVLVEYERRKVRKHLKQMRFGNTSVHSEKGGAREFKNEGGEFDVPPPSIVVDKLEEADFVELRNVEKILNSPDLTISQKYRSLGIDEDPFDQGPDEEGACWQWFKYKLQRFYLSQWPISKDND